MSPDEAGSEGKPGRGRRAPTPAERYVFVVGVPRSGTHLVRRVLNASPFVRIGLESRFVGSPKRVGPLRLPGRRIAFRAEAVRTDEGARRVVARVWRAARDKERYADFWVRLARQTTEDAFLRELLAIPDRDARHVLELAMWWASRGRRVAGEKTPHHVFELDRLLEWYPSALAIHVIRDPRAVYASARTRGWTGPARLGLGPSGPLSAVVDAWSALELTLRWRYAMTLDRSYAVSYPGRYIAVRYESLVREPEREIRRLCDFVGEPFDEAMLRPRVAASSFMPDGAEGIRSDALHRWRQELDERLSAWIALVAGPALADLGYPSGSAPA